MRMSSSLVRPGSSSRRLASLALSLATLPASAWFLSQAGELLTPTPEQLQPRRALHAATPERPPGAPEQTQHPDAPPREIGPRFDDDAAMRTKADAVASYWLKASLDETAHRITASGRIKWRNSSRVAVRQLWFHLYLNAFKNAGTLFLRSPFGAGRSGDKAESWGYIDLKKLSASELSGVDLLKNAAKHSPDDPADQTDIRVDLPREVAPGEVLTLNVEWEAQLPEIVERTGYLSDYHFVAQWFPKLARLEPDGTWKHFAFHPQSEFYADYGSYDVTLDVPQSYVVGASGEQIESKLQGDRRVVRHRLDDVHDFAWTAWPGFHEQSEEIDGVAVRLLYPGGHDKNAADSFEALRFALPHFSRRYGRYPYKTLTVVHPPSYARNSGGMEYPTLITTGGPWHSGYTNRGVPGVTIHELGHQWFYGLVGTDEHSWPFLDEGLNSYAELVAMRERYTDSSLVSLPGLSVNRESALRAAAAWFGEDDVVGRPATAFPSFRSLGALVYARTATILDTLANVYGRQEMQTALGRYMRYYRFAHPGPRHFIAAIREVMGDEAAQNLERALFERGRVDYLVRSVESREATEQAGVFDEAEGRRTLSPDKPTNKTYVGRALVFRHGDLKLPVQVLMLAEDGTRSIQEWDGRSAWAEFRYTGASPLARVVVDPERRVSLDSAPLNNAASRVKAPSSRTRERATYAAQLGLGLVAP